VRFVDTNVLLYSVSKAAIDREILRDRDLALSTQVLQELDVQATMPSPHKLSTLAALVRIDSLATRWLCSTSSATPRGSRRGRRRSPSPPR